MANNQFKITDYSALHAVKRDTFTEAVRQAHQYAAVGNLPATIIDKHGCRWTVWMGAQPELQDCPAVTNGNGPCECERV